MIVRVNFLFIFDLLMKSEQDVCEPISFLLFFWLLSIHSGAPIMPRDVSQHYAERRQPTFAVRETASLGIMGAPWVPPLNPSETIVLSMTFRFPCLREARVCRHNTRDKSSIMARSAE